MKTIYSFCLFFLLFTTSLLQAQVSSSEQHSGKHKISVDILSGMWGRVPLTSELGAIYHRKLSQNLELSAKLAYSSINIFLKRSPLTSGGKLQDSVGVNGLALGSSIYYFLNKSEQSGWFMGMEGNYTLTHFQDKNIKSKHFNLSKLSTSFIIGYRLGILSDNIELDVFIGVGTAFRNYRWQKFGGESSNGATNSEVVNASWERGWALELEPSMTIATPLGIRLGYRF